MFELFTDDARLVLAYAQEHAKRLGHPDIGTGHLLLALLGVEGTGTADLVEKGLDSEYVEKALASRRAEVTESVGHLPFTARARKSLELASRMAGSLGSQVVATGHLLLGLLAIHDSLAVEIISARVPDLAVLRADVIRELKAAKTVASEQVEPGRTPWRGRAKARQVKVARDLRYSTPTQPRTPAGSQLGVAAERLAGAGPVGSQHVVMAALADPNSAAAKALASLGLTAEQVVEALRAVDVTGTSDDMSPAAPRLAARLVLTPGLLSLRTTDPELLVLAEAVIGGDTGTLHGAGPGGEVLGDVIETLRESLLFLLRARG